MRSCDWHVVMLYATEWTRLSLSAIKSIYVNTTVNLAIVLYPYPNDHIINMLLVGSGCVHYCLH